MSNTDPILAFSLESEHVLSAKEIDFIVEKLKPYSDESLIEAINTQAHAAAMSSPDLKETQKRIESLHPSLRPIAQAEFDKMVKETINKSTDKFYKKAPMVRNILTKLAVLKFALRV